MYTHFNKIPSKGVGPCTILAKQRLKIMRAQQRVKGLSPLAHSPLNQQSETRALMHPNTLLKLENNTNVIVTAGSSIMPSQNIISFSHKKTPFTCASVDMFDIKGREGIDLTIERFFLLGKIPFSIAQSPR